MLAAVPSAEPLSIAQVSPYRRGSRTGHRVRRAVSAELERRGHEVLRTGTRRPVKGLLKPLGRAGHRPRPRAVRPERLLGGAAPLLLAQRRHLPRAAGAGALDPGRAAAGRDLLRPHRRPHGDERGDRRAARSATSPPTYELIEAGAASGGLGRGSPTSSKRSTAASLARRHDPTGDPELRARLAERPLIEVDLHMHTDHSGDCATPVEVLLQTARDRGLGAIAITDHNEVSGALEARRIAEEMGGPQGDRRRGGEDRRAGRGDRPLPRGEDPEGA